MLRRTTFLIIAAVLAGCGGSGHTTPKPPLAAARRGATLTIHYAQNVLRARAAALAHRTPKFVDPLGDTLTVTSSITGGFNNGSYVDYPSATSTYGVAPDPSGNQTLTNVPVFDGTATLTVTEYINGTTLATVTVHTSLSATSANVLDQVPDGTIDAPLKLQIVYGELIVNGDATGSNLPFGAGTSAVSINYDTLGTLGLDCPNIGNPYASYLTHTVQFAMADAAGAYAASGTALINESTGLKVTVTSDSSNLLPAGSSLTATGTNLAEYPVQLGFIDGVTATKLVLSVTAGDGSGTSHTIPVTITGTPGSNGTSPTGATCL